jgi:PAS domain S-box-containing protein
MRFRLRQLSHQRKILSSLAFFFCLILIQAVFHSATPARALPLATSSQLDQASLTVSSNQAVNRSHPSNYAFSNDYLWIAFALSAGLSIFLLFDILLRRRAQKELERQKERVDLLLNSTAEAIYGLDPQGICTFCNPATLRLLGYQQESDLLGRNIHELIHHTRSDGSHCPADECRIFQAYSRNAPLHLEGEILWRTDGTSFPAEIWSHPIRKGKETIGAVVTFLDITERRRAEAKMDEALQELNSFVYTVSHDLRSPLTSILGFSEVLQMRYANNLDETACMALDEIQHQGRRMSAMIEDLLALAKVGNLPLPEAPIDTNEVLQEVLRTISDQIANSDLVVRLKHLPPVRVPRTLLSQIFVNLIGNALCYAGPEGGPIEVGGTQDRSKVRFYVRDHGPGIPPEERQRIFEVFYRGTTGAKASGTGIGLATVIKIAMHYGGRAWVEPTQGGGATFWVEMEAP